MYRKLTDVVRSSSKLKIIVAFLNSTLAMNPSHIVEYAT